MKSSITVKTLKILPALIAIAALVGGYLIFDTAQHKKSKDKRFKHPTKAKIVKVAPLRQQDYQPTWQSSGMIKPAQQLRVMSEVVGKVIQLPEQTLPGTIIESGTLLARIDDASYRLTLASKSAQLQQNLANLTLEQGKQRLAQEEFILIKDTLDSEQDTDLILRKPQIIVAKAKVNGAQTEVKKAELALAKTSLRAPFKAKIINRSIAIGSKVGQNTELFSLVNVEQYWLEVKLPLAFLPLLNREKPALVQRQEIWAKQSQRKARYVSTLANLDAKDRQVKVLYAIDDPLGLENPALASVFINDFLQVQLPGITLEDVWRIKPTWLLGDNTLWVVDKDNKLQKRQATIIFKSRDSIYLRAPFENGDRALAEKIDVATPNMPVRVRNKRANS